MAPPRKNRHRGFNIFEREPAPNAPLAHVDFKKPIAGTKYKRGDDPTKILLKRGQYRTPWLGDQDGAFVWPAGLEAFRLEGSSAVGIHKYLGTANLDATVQHYDEPRITISGVFQGKRATDNMVSLRAQCVKRSRRQGKILYMPNLDYLRYVVVDSYAFEHAQDDRTGGISYTITMLVIGEGERARHQRLDPSYANESVMRKVRQTPKVFVVTAKTRTLRQIAAIKYKDGDKWLRLYRLNKNQPWMKNWRPGKLLPLKYKNKPVMVRY